ncbi:MAG TPA: class I SAM-dependent methyltransferase [Gaiellaceae bacterium]|nr:class I SAM-dependent methyltransferase [Gaiellaceae bacterium]
MSEYGPATYGDRIADVYDAWYGEAAFLATDDSVDVLAELAGPGPALELAIGTGRVALPLAARGIEVHGVDASERMVEKLRGKPGGAGIPVTIGDFADVPVEGRFRLVYVAFNTFFALPSQEDQIRCFENVAAHLADDGVFALDVFVPDPARFAGGRISVTEIGDDLLRLDTTRLDTVTQTSRSQHVVLTPRGATFYPVQVRWAYPPELDLMARLAGLRLLHRWGNWRKDPFTAESTMHVSVYGR